MIKLCMLLSAVTLVTGSNGCATYEVYRGARVPLMTPAPHSGQPMGRSRLEAGFMVARVVDAGAPESGKSDAGLHLPSYQGRGDLRIRVTDNLTLGAIYERGLEEGSRALRKGTPDPDGDTVGGGLSLHYSLPLGSSHLRIGIGLDLLVYSIPFVEYLDCIDNCSPLPYVVKDWGRAGEMVGNVAITPSYRVSQQWTIFSGLTLRNHPTIDRTGIESGLVVDDDVNGGPANVIVSAGAEYTHRSGVKGLLFLYQTVTADPVQYYPTVAAALSIPLLMEPHDQCKRPRNCE